MPEPPLRSQEVQDILSRPPHGLLRKGSMIMAGWLGVFIALSWFISYPDIVHAPARLTTQTPPLKLTSHVDGRLEKVCVSDKMEVAAKACLARLDHPLKESTAVALTETIALIEHHLRDPSRVPLNSIELVLCPGLLGDVQTAYAALQKAWQAYRCHLGKALFVQKQQTLQSQAAAHQKLMCLIKHQLTWSKRHAERALEIYQAHRKLYQSGAISKQAWLTQQEKYLSTQQAHTALQRQHQQHQLEHQIKTLQLATLVLEHQQHTERLHLELRQAVQSLQEQLGQWRRRYIIQTPIAGQVHRCQASYENASIRAGEPLFVITDPRQPCIVEAWVSAQFVGKVKPGQRASVKLEAYPATTFGHLEAVVEDVSALPEEMGYRVRCSLCQALRSTQGKILPRQPELEASVEIVTEQMRLWQHLLRRLKGK